MINLCLVVATQFSETKRRETERMHHERALRRCNSDSSSVSMSPALSTTVSVFSTGASCYSEMFRYVEHLSRRAWRRLCAAVTELRRRRRADAADPAADADELGALRRQQARRRRRRGRRKPAGKTLQDVVEMNSVGPPPSVGGATTPSRRQHHVTVTSRRTVTSPCHVTVTSPRHSAGTEGQAVAGGGADELLKVTVRPASPLAPYASPEPSELGQSSLTLNRSSSSLEPPRLMLPQSIVSSHQFRNPRWSSPTGMEDVDLGGPAAGSTADDVDRPRQPRSVSSPRLHAQHIGVPGRIYNSQSTRTFE